MKAVPKSILAATDFSETADQAGALARDLARRFSAAFHLLHVIVLLDDPHIEERNRLRLEELVATGDETRLQALENEVMDRGGVEITPHMVRGIAPAEVIVESASDLGCELIVMGTHGRRGLSHLLLGSVAERVVRTSAMPVLTVRIDAAINPEGITKILVPHDFSSASTVAVRHAAAWAQALDAEIMLLHVVEPVVYPEFYSVDVFSDDITKQLISRSEKALRGVADELLGGLRHAVEVKVGRAADIIVNVAEPDRFDMVVMATRGLSGLEHVLLGSVAESVLRRSRVPMLTIPGG
jgi:nucleotide-binding universal stress UspA family protein